jgi:hypothetical protein
MHVMQSGSTLNAHASSLCRHDARRKTDYDARQITTHNSLSGGHAVRVTSSGGFVLRKVFCTVPSRLIGHHFTGRVCDDRIDLFPGASFVLTLPRALATRLGPHQHVASYHHVIHSLPQKPLALMGLTYRDHLFPRQAFRGLFDRMLEQTSDKQACRMIVDLLALAHDRGCDCDCDCEAGLAARIEEDMRPK